jgi:hypothetical protein
MGANVNPYRAQWASIPTQTDGTPYQNKCKPFNNQSNKWLVELFEMQTKHIGCKVSYGLFKTGCLYVSLWMDLWMDNCVLLVFLQCLKGFARFLMTVQQYKMEPDVNVPSLESLGIKIPLPGIINKIK